MDNSTLVARPSVDPVRAKTDFVALLPDRAMVQIVCAPECRSDIRDRVSANFGCDLPEKPSLVAGNGFEFAWTGPGRWLAMGGGAPETCMARFSVALADTASLVDVSDAYATFRLTGPGATEALTKLVPIDLGPSAFRPSAVALTHIAHVAVIVIQRGPEPVFDILPPRSFAAAIVGWIGSHTPSAVQ